jgi:hypothetical protein
MSSTVVIVVLCGLYCTAICAMAVQHLVHVEILRRATRDVDNCRKIANESSEIAFKGWQAAVYWQNEAMLAREALDAKQGEDTPTKTDPLRSRLVPRSDGTYTVNRPQTPYSQTPIVESGDGKDFARPWMRLKAKPTPTKTDQPPEEPPQ